MEGCGEERREERAIWLVGGLASAAFCPWIKSFGLFPTQENKCSTLRTQKSTGLKVVQRSVCMVRGNNWDVTHSNKTVADINGTRTVKAHIKEALTP